MIDFNDEKLEKEAALDIEDEEWGENKLPDFDEDEDEEWGDDERDEEK